MMGNNNKAAFDQLHRHSDSLLTKVFARSISAYISIRLAKTNITPLQITIVSLLTGLFAAFIGSKPIYFFGILAAFFMELSHVLDCVDGELARLTQKGNLFSASMDPISDRIKDSALILAAYVQGANIPPFGLSSSNIALIALVTMGMWLCYMYIVDAFLNPASRKYLKCLLNKKIYLGLYDLFVYGSIAFWLTNNFNYFLFFVFILSGLGITIQIIRLKKILTFEHKPY